MSLFPNRHTILRVALSPLVTAEITVPADASIDAVDIATLIEYLSVAHRALSEKASLKIPGEGKETG